MLWIVNALLPTTTSAPVSAEQQRRVTAAVGALAPNTRAALRVGVVCMGTLGRRARAPVAPRRRRRRGRLPRGPARCGRLAGNRTHGARRRGEGAPDNRPRRSVRRSAGEPRTVRYGLRDSHPVNWIQMRPGANTRDQRGRGSLSREATSNGQERGRFQPYRKLFFNEARAANHPGSEDSVT